MARINSLLLLLAAIWLPCSASGAEDPLAGEKFTIYYGLHEDPNDPESPIAMELRVSVMAEDSSGVEINDRWCPWRITELRIRRFTTTGKLRGAWIEESPTVSTDDGFWWVKHMDPENPQLSEFASIPEITGVAEAEVKVHVLEPAPGPVDRPWGPLTPPAERQGSALVYTLESSSYTSPLPSGLPPYTPTFGLTYDFGIQETGVKVRQGDEEPVEPSDVPVWGDPVLGSDGMALPPSWDSETRTFKRLRP